ncbi:putative endo-polygalacturonase [Helianthus debilis subsp. tardiflorus]
MCDGFTGRVKSLHLERRDTFFFLENALLVKRLVGKELSTSLGVLRHLKHLDLSGNFFLGSRIPEFIGSLKQLTYLNLSNAYFSGIIPHHIGNLSNLKSLDLSYNSYNDNPLIAHDMDWLSGLSSLKHINLSYVNLTRAKILKAATK